MRVAILASLCLTAVLFGTIASRTPAQVDPGSGTVLRLSDSTDLAVLQYLLGTVDVRDAVAACITTAPCVAVSFETSGAAGASRTAYLAFDFRSSSGKVGEHLEFVYLVPPSSVYGGTLTWSISNYDAEDNSPVAFDSPLEFEFLREGLTTSGSKIAAIAGGFPFSLSGIESTAIGTAPRIWCALVLEHASASGQVGTAAVLARVESPATATTPTVFGSPFILR